MQTRLSPDALDAFTFAGRQLASLTAWNVGGAARRLIVPRNTGELTAAVAAMATEGERWETLGGGSNVLINDGVIDTPIIHTVMLDEIDVTDAGERVFVKCSAGVPLRKVFALSLREHWSGLECLAGIPGTVAGALIGNAGTSKGDISSSVHKVSAIEPDGSTEEINAVDIEWGYRRSSLSEPGGRVISEVVLGLTRSTKEEVLNKARSAIDERKSQPVNAKTAGCVFKNPPGYFAGKLLDDAGCKGMAVGGARVSERHANFFENFGGCSASDIIGLVRLCIRRVEDRFGVSLKPEIKTIGFDEEPFKQRDA